MNEVVSLQIPHPDLISDLSKGVIGGFQGRGVFVPYGLDAELVLECGRALERKFDVPPYTATDMAIAVFIEVAIVLHRRKPGSHEV